MATAALGQELRVGAAAVEIVADDSMPIAGGIGPWFAKGQEGKLRATAVVIEKAPGPPVAIVSCDVLFVCRDFVDPALAEIEKNHGIPAANVLVHATHTHHAPSVTRVHEYDRSQAFADRLQRGIVEAVGKAKGVMADSTFAFKLAEEKTVGQNSRLLLKDGTTFWVGSREDVVGPTGPFDPDLPVFVFRSPAGKFQAMLFGHSTHSIGALKAGVRSPSFYGMAAQDLESRLGGTVAFLEGASGSTHNLDLKPDVMFERIRAAVSAAMETAEPRGVSRLASLKREFTFKIRTFDEAAEEKAVRDYCTKKLGQGAEPVAAVFRQMRKELAPQQGKDRTTWLQVVAVGDVAIVGVPAEFFTKLGMDIKRQSPFKNTVVAELSNDWVGYVGDRDAYKLGGYQLWMGHHSYAEPGTGERIVDQCVAMLRELASSK
jgi:neutral ceramidase